MQDGIRRTNRQGSHSTQREIATQRPSVHTNSGVINAIEQSVTPVTAETNSINHAQALKSDHTVPDYQNIQYTDQVDAQATQHIIQ